MDAVHLHLFLNHVPVLGSVFATALLTYAMVRKSSESMLLAMTGLTLSAVIAVPVLLSGEPAEEAVETLAGVGEAFVEAHESAAKIAFWALAATGAASGTLVFLGVFGKKSIRAAGWMVLVMAVISSGLMLRAAGLGGQIRHSEIRTPNAAVQPAAKEREKEKDHDDH